MDYLRIFNKFFKKNELVFINLSIIVLICFSWLCLTILFYYVTKSYVLIIVKILLLILPLLLSIAYFTLVERKILGFMQRRRGPNVIGFFGLLQPIADGVKLILKETILPTHANKIIFLLAPILTFTLSLLN
jgi:NADH:ubiquinone oxidoreductase subunit H